MRICILCEESKVLQVREKMKNDKILQIDLSPTGELPATHKMCVMAVTEQKAQEMINSAELTIIEAMNPKEFLEKHNLKKITSFEKLSNNTNNLLSSKLLGRNYIKDDRDNNFLIESLLTSTQPKKITSRFWDDNIWWGNQGNTPQCVGYAWAHWIDDGPITHNLPHPNINPTLIYREAQKVDEWPGENYAGTSVRGGAKYLKTQNKISAYYWAFDVNTLINAVLNLGPVVVGTNWYYNMFFPDRNGLIRASGYLAGGHAYVINGVDTIKKQFRIKNSWGRNWGQQGRAFISFNDMTRLIRERGEICLATESRF